MSPQAPPPPGVPAGWYPDPERDDSQRYWDGEQWTDQRAPLPPSGWKEPNWTSGKLDEQGRFVAGLALAGLGALVAVISVFLPIVDLESSLHISDNSLIQHEEGIWIIVIALAGGAAGMSLRGRPGCLAAGVLLVIFALAAGSDPPLYYYNTFSERIAGDPSAGAGVWALGIGGVILACAAIFADWSRSPVKGGGKDYRDGGTAAQHYKDADNAGPGHTEGESAGPGYSDATASGQGDGDATATAPGHGYSDAAAAGQDRREATTAALDPDVDKNAPVGWYPNPDNSSEERLWDGERWTTWLRPVRRGRVDTDPAAWHPSKPGKERLWSGDVWTDYERDAIS